MVAMLLGIDIGTSACKIAVFEHSGEVVAQSLQSYPVNYPRAGWAEQDPDQWWEAICAGIREVLQRVDPAQIQGIGLDGQGWSCIPIDKEGRRLYQTPIWMDTRAQAICQEVLKDIPEERIFSVAGNGFLPSYTTPKMLWFQREHPEIFANTWKFLQSHSYIGLKLTGCISQDVCSAYGLHFFDMHKQQYDEDLAQALGLSTHLVPDLSPCHAVIGTVTQGAAALTGLKAGTPVVAGGLDAACGTLGAGVVQVGQTQEQGGQAGGMSICVDRALAHPKLILSTHVVPDLWLLQGGTVGGGASMKWFQQELGRDKGMAALDEEAAQVAPGAEGTVYLPYMAGERSPIWNPDAKGVFYGLDFSKTRGHMVRAVLEGVAFSLEHNLRTAREVGVEVDTLRCMGGAANSRIWTQIKADVTGKSIEVPESDHATTLGAVILAGVGVGIYPDFAQATADMVAVKRTHEPNEANHQLYQACMNRYLDLYQALKHQFSSAY